MGLAHNQPSKIYQFKINKKTKKNLYEENILLYIQSYSLIKLINKVYQ